MLSIAAMALATLSARAADGKALYDQSCAKCHGADGKGDTKIGKVLGVKDYTDAAVHARVVKPDPRANAEYTKKLHEAIRTATTYFNGAERFLMTDRGLERADAVLTYDGQSRATGERLKTVDAALAAARSCPALYQACQEAFSKQCSEPLAPTS